MTSITFKQIIYRLSILGVIMGILVNTYDILIGTFLETLHILFEVIEVLLDNVVEHLFHTGVHETQIIVFYILIVGGIAIVYGLSHVLANFYHNLINMCRSGVDTCRSCKVSVNLYWQELSLLRKITWVACMILIIIASLMFSGLM